MRPLFDDLDEFDFSDSMAVRRIRREQQREERRPADRRFHGPKDEYEFDDFSDFDHFDRFDRFDKDRFDMHSRRGEDH